MNSRDKILIGIMVVLVLTFVYFGLGFGETTGEIVSLSDAVSEYHTVAICDENGFCQDYEVYCDNESLVAMMPVEGAFVSHEEGWVDPRGNYSLC